MLLPTYCLLRTFKNVNSLFYGHHPPSDRSAMDAIRISTFLSPIWKLVIAYSCNGWVGVEWEKSRRWVGVGPAWWLFFSMLQNGILEAFSDFCISFWKNCMGVFKVCKINKLCSFVLHCIVNIPTFGLFLIQGGARGGRGWGRTSCLLLCLWGEWRAGAKLFWTRHNIIIRTTL